eukprot:542623-Pelagomonas_calceolata.AAC.3
MPVQHFSACRDGLGLLNQVLDMVVPALAELVMRPKEDACSLKGQLSACIGYHATHPLPCFAHTEQGLSPIQACENAVCTLAGVATMEAGCMACLTYRVPRAVVSLIKRGISGVCVCVHACLYVLTYNV